MGYTIIDVVCRLGRILATGRSLYIQSRDLLVLLGYFNETLDDLDEGPEL